MSNDIAALLMFIKKAERLKAELRHSWLSDKTRQESVAEHSWMLALIAMAIFDSIDLRVDQLKVLKLVTIHDLAEAVIGDIPAFDASGREGKFEREKAAMEEITAGLPPATAKEFMALWHEMEDNKTAEAKLAQCLDKIEALIQHIIADIDTWGEGDYSLGPYHKDELFDLHPYLREFKDYVNQEFWKKMDDADKLSHIPPQHLARRHNAAKS